MATKKPTGVPENTEQKNGAGGTRYTVDEFAAAAGSVFGKNMSPDIVTTALTIDGKGAYTEEEALEIVRKFADKEVK